VYDMHGKDLLGARVTVEHAKVRCNCKTHNNLLSASSFLGGRGAFGFALSAVMLSIFVIFVNVIYNLNTVA
jgi:hypothetical protein